MAAYALLLFILLCSDSYIAHGGDDHGVVVMKPRPFEPEPAECSTSFSVPIRAAVSMPLVHRHGPCAPSQSTQKPSFAETLRRSRARASNIMSRARASNAMVSMTQDDGTNVTIPTHLGGAVDSLEYVVTVGLGTPAVSQILLMDTGSDLSWVQCAPCNSTSCYPQKDPLFDPSKSSTYAPIPCDTDTCRNLVADRSQNGCTDGGADCGYRIEYGDGSKTRGVYSNDTLTLEPGVTVEDFRFGCAPVYGGAFSYCLPATNTEAGFLALGTPSANGTGFAFTPMSHLPDSATSYMVTLAGISVGGKRLDIPASAFRGGMIIDSGTVVTGLPETAYNALQRAFRKAMAAYPLLPHGDLDTCYNFTGFSNVTVPKVSFTFRGGGTVDLDVPNGVLLNDCLAFTESGPDVGLGIIGNVNQRTLEVLYDVGAAKVGFRAGAC
ncbi:unnamed protein product [Urochloa decumbens]|uniref:Peptidase A1 domain-containing protein n=1 Tax=Urochloa decumbens TaxID=240449 RepID=A0ABC9DFB3_9POAL